MAYRLRLAARAERDIDDFLDWLAEFSPEVAARHERDLSASIRDHLLVRPHMWQFFFLTGQPYRAYLYSVSRRTSFWLVYTIDEEAKTVDVLRFWNAARDPGRFGA